MRCTECHHPDSKVVDSRNVGDHIRRRRECLACGARFTTHERVEAPLLWVLKRNGVKEPFSTEKVLHGIALATRKRPIDADQLDELVREVVARLHALRTPVVPSSTVGEAVMAVLRGVDEVAYVRFASVYGAFESVDQFVEAIRPLQERR